MLGYDDDNLEYLRIELVDMGINVKLRKYNIKQLATEYLGVSFFIFTFWANRFGLTILLFIYFFCLVAIFLVASSFGQGQDDLLCGPSLASARSRFHPLSPGEWQPQLRVLF